MFSCNIETNRMLQWFKYFHNLLFFMLLLIIKKDMQNY